VVHRSGVKCYISRFFTVAEVQQLVISTQQSDWVSSVIDYNIDIHTHTHVHLTRTLIMSVILLV